MVVPPRPGKRLLVISDDDGRAMRTARMLRALGYDTAVSDASAALTHCRQDPPLAAVVAAADEGIAAVQDRLREMKSLQQRGELPSFPIIAAGRPEGETAVDLVDGVVLEPGRLTSLAIEVSKQVGGARGVSRVKPLQS
jgi:hypothetical protein